MVEQTPYKLFVKTGVILNGALTKLDIAIIAKKYNDITLGHNVNKVLKIQRKLSMNNFFY